MPDTKEEVAKPTPTGVELSIEKIKYDMSQDRYSGCLGRSRRAVSYLLEKVESLQEESERLKAVLSKIAEELDSEHPGRWKDGYDLQLIARDALKEDNG
jgi:hypothetical protein